MAHVAWTPAAERDLECIFLYIGREQRSPLAAARVIRAIVDKADFYAAEPLLAVARPELGLAIRAFYVHRYSIIFRPAADGIEVIRVIHGSRDVSRVFHHPSR